MSRLWVSTYICLVIQSPFSPSSFNAHTFQISLGQWECRFWQLPANRMTDKYDAFTVSERALNIEISINNLPHLQVLWESRRFHPASKLAPRTKRPGEISFNCEIRHRGWITFWTESTRVRQFVKTVGRVFWRHTYAHTHSDDVIRPDETLESFRTRTENREKAQQADGLFCARLWNEKITKTRGRVFLRRKIKMFFAEILLVFFFFTRGIYMLICISAVRFETIARACQS